MRLRLLDSIGLIRGLFVAVLHAKRCLEIIFLLSSINRLNSGKLVYGVLLPKDTAIQAYSEQKKQGFTTGIVRVTQ